MQLSVVMCAHDEERFVGEQLTALRGQVVTEDFEVVVVDNRSTDRTVAIVRHHQSEDGRIRLVRANERADKSYAMNVGADAATGELMAFCDADDIVADGWLQSIADALVGHPVVTGPHKLDALNSAWLAESRGRSIERESVGSFQGLFPTIRGASWGIRREVWESLGGMTEGLHPVEDQEFSLRCWLEGHDIVGVDGAVIHYRYRESLGDLWRQGFAYGSNRPLIARMVNQSGRARAKRFSGVKSWAALVLALPRIGSVAGRAKFCWILANRLGQVVGSVRFRTISL